MSRLLLSANLELRLLHLPDADELFCLINENREHLRRWLPWLDETQTVSDTRSFIRSATRNFIRTRAFVAGVRWQGRLAGIIGHNRIDWQSRTSFPGYWLGCQFEGKGIMTASCHALLEHAFFELGLEKVVLTCATENLRSRAIPERLGFRLEGIQSEAEWLYDHFVDHAAYAITRAEFIRRRKKKGPAPL